jgi:branched-chain amino acid transport system permease protein
VSYPSGTEGGFDARALWRQQRDRWHHLPERTRRIVVLVVQAVIVLALLPWYGFALLLAIFFALSWIPHDLAVTVLGRAWVAIREDEIAAAAMGIPLMRTKTWAYASGAFFGGVAGAFFASFKSSTFPNDFSFNISAFILSMVILGGMGNVWGVIVGGAVLAYLNQEGLANIGSKIGIPDVPLYSSGIFGAIIVIVMLFRPEGLIPSRRRAAELHEGVHDEPLYDVQA